MTSLKGAVEQGPTPVSNNSNCLCILGMHRSGTSCLTGILQGFHVHLGDVFTQNPFNAKGNREHPRIMQLNDAVLDHNGGAWNKPVDSLAWTKQHQIERDDIVMLLQAQGNPYWGFKDPRTLLTLPFWLESIQPRFIGTFRHPAKVAGSLAKRNRYPLEQSFALWEAYNKRLLSAAVLYEFPLINFDNDPAQYLTDVVQQAVSLGLDPKYTSEASAFFEHTLRQQEHALIESAPLPDNIRQLYDELKRYHAEAQSP